MQPREKVIPLSETERMGDSGTGALAAIHNHLKLKADVVVTTASAHCARIEATKLRLYAKQLGAHAREIARQAVTVRTQANTLVTK